MATRRERVVLTLDDDFSGGMAKAAAVTALLNRELNNLSGSSVASSRASQSFSRDMQSISREAKGAERSINQLTGRLRLFADAAAVFGPGTVPVGGVLAAGVAGFASQLGFAAVAGGVLAGSMQGLGDALGAMNKAQLEPTDKNLEAAHDALKRLSPATRDFANQLFALKPALVAIRDIGSESLVPGLSEAFDSIETLGPRVAGIFQSVAGALGEIAADSAASLASDRWADFFQMIQDEAPQALSEMASAIGDVTHGLAEMWMAFAPLNADFSSWLMDVADGFDQWATGLSATEGFQNFLDYVRETGPQVAATVGALANAIVQIVQASAPLGGPVLAGIEAFAKVLGAIADSDIGTPIMVGVSALALYNRTLAATAAAQKRVDAGGGLFGMIGKQQGMTQGAFAAVRKDVELLGSTWATTGARTAREQERMAMGAASLKGNVKALGIEAAKASAPVAGMAIIASGAADSFGLTNTASLALMGTMAGPWGAAVGAGAGLLLDWKAAGDRATEASENFKRSLQGLSLSELRTQLADINETLATPVAVTTGNSSQAQIDEAEANQDKKKALQDQIALTEKLDAAQTARSRRAALAYASEVGLNANLASWNRKSTEEITAMADALAKVREAGQKTASTFLGFGDSLNDAKVSLGDFIKDMQESANALANFNNNSLRAARRGLDEGLIGSLRDAGKEGALRMKQLANATDEEINRANQAYRRQQRELERTMDITAKLAGYSPVELKINANTQSAMSALYEVQRFKIADKTFQIHAVRVGGAADGGADFVSGGSRNGNYWGGGFTGPGGKYEPAGVVHRGEVVIPQELVKRDWSMLSTRYGHLPGFAKGGVVGKPKPAKIDETPSEETEAQRQRREAREQRQAEREANRQAAEAQRQEAAEQAQRAAIEAQEEASRRFLAAIEGQERAAQGLIDAAKTQRDSAVAVREEWSQAMDRTGQAATAGFRSSLFGGSTSRTSGLSVGKNGSGSTWLDALNGDIAGLGERSGLIAQLQAQGISGSALEALMSGSNADISSILNSGQAGQFAALYAQREALQAAVSGQAGQAAYGAQYAATDAAVAAVDARIQFLEAQLAAISAQRPITVYESISAEATAAEIARQMAMQGAA